MEQQNFTASFSTGKSPQEVFDAINNVRGWWTENTEGSTEKLNDVFEVHFGDVHYSQQKLTEVLPAQKIVWLVTDSRLNFLKDKSEWTDTKISFDISERDGHTQLRFKHEGLVPGIECYGACSGAWSYYVDSLQQLIDTGKGKPEPKAVTTA